MSARLRTRLRSAAPLRSGWRHRGWSAIARHCDGSIRLGLVFALAAIASPARDLSSLVPPADALAGWSRPDAPKIFAGDGLFELIDGGAELYREYGFRQVVSWRLENASRSGLQLEIYEMTDAAAAFGVYSLQLSGKATPIALGQEGALFDYYLVFWSGPYVVSITGSRPTDDVRSAVRQAAQLLADRMPKNGSLPSWFALLPAQGRLYRQYFRGRIGLSNIDRPPLGDLVESTEGLCGTYPGVRWFVFPFASPAKVRAQIARALVALRQSDSWREGRATPNGFAATAADGRHLLARPSGSALFVFLYRDEADLQRLP